jgi:Ca-activated chloride channel family protein
MQVEKPYEYFAARVCQAFRKMPPVALVVLTAGAPLLNSQSDTGTRYRVDVNMVVLTFSVTDKKGNHVNGLKPEDIRIFEDETEQKIASFAEGSRLFRLVNEGPGSAGTNVFILFDTSNRMYASIPYVCDAIADFVRRLAPADSAAIYTFSRNLFRAAPLSQNHNAARAGLSNISAGDDTALFNSVLLTLRDAARIPGRKAIVVFSNGPDNASVLGPGDVGRVAENEGIPIYVISTRDATQDRTLFDALQSLTARTGGKLYCARNWQQQAEAFTSVREDIGNSYTAYYYPSPNPNQGYRTIRLEVVSPGGKAYRVLARPGYEARREPPYPTNN